MVPDIKALDPFWKHPSKNKDVRKGAKERMTMEVPPPGRNTREHSSHVTLGPGPSWRPWWCLSSPPPPAHVPPFSCHHGLCVATRQRSRLPAVALARPRCHQTPGESWLAAAPPGQEMEMLGVFGCVVACCPSGIRAMAPRTSWGHGSAARCAWLSWPSLSFSSSRGMEELTAAAFAAVPSWALTSCSVGSSHGCDLRASLVTKQLDTSTPEAQCYRQ